MNKILIIIQREFLKRVQKKSFILLTLLTPVIMAALVCVPLWLSSIEDDDQLRVAVVDPTGEYYKSLKVSQTFHFTSVPCLNNEMRSEDSPYDAVVSISGDLVHNKGRVVIYSNKEVPGNLLEYVQSNIGAMVEKQKVAASGIAELRHIMDDVQRELPVETVKWNAKGDSMISNTGVAMAVGLLFTTLIYMFTLSYGGMVMQSVIEEKTNRIVELMVSSVNPFQLMMGKIIGVMLVGLLQMAIWGVLLFVILTGASAYFGLDASQAAAVSQPGMAVPAAAQGNAAAQEIFGALANMPYMEIGVMFILMFLGGYLFYASFYAAVGASVNEQEDSNQFVLPVTLITLFGFYAALYSIQNTDGPLAFWASLFPLTSPVVMMVRIPFGVPLWQEVLSVALLYASAILMVWLGAKVYRVGILMYGKKPSFKELVKWMRYR